MNLHANQLEDLFRIYSGKHNNFPVKFCNLHAITFTTKIMKKTYLFLFVLIFISLIVNAQYTLLHEFQTSDFVSTFDTKSQTMYYVVEYSEETIHFYNEDFSFYKSATIPELSGYETYMNSSFEHVSTNIFNDDELIEFSCKYIKEGSGVPAEVIYNENLLQVAFFDSAHIQSVYQTVSGQIRMDVRKYEYPMTVYQTQTFLLQELSTSVGYNDQDQPKPVFPNPARIKVNLPYMLETGQIADMKIYDTNGQLIKTIKIGAHFNQVALDISGFKPGLYIYRYNNKSGKFLVN